MNEREVVLKVAEGLSQDVGAGRARLDTETRMQLGVSPGDVVEIEGGRKTGAVVWRARPVDEGKGIIRIDNLTRKNARVGIGDKVIVRKAYPKVAERVVIAPAISQQRIQFGHGIENLVKRGLLKRPVTAGDTIVIPGIALFGNSLPFGVVKTDPKGIVLIGEETEIIVKEEPIKEELLRLPQVSYEDIGGLHEEIMKIREMIELPLKHPELFERLGIDPPKGVLLYGPPGTGKTLIARAVANESGASFFTINGPEIMSKFYGQSEENLRKTFEEAERNAPSIIFIDEIDAIAPKREEVHGEVERRVVSQLLTLMDGLKGRGKVIVIGATNRPDSIDPALRRPGRFDREIEIGVPDRNGRKEILQIHTRGMPLYNWDAEVAIEELLKRIRKFEGKEIERVKEEIEKDRSILEKIVNEMGNIEQSEINGFENYKETLLKNLEKKDKKLREIGEILVEIGIISEEYREAVKKASIQKMIDYLADVTHGFVGADLAALAREAAMNALRRYLPEIDLDRPIPTEVLRKMVVTMKDFKEALKSIEPSALREVLVEIPKVRWNDIGGLHDVKQRLREAVEWPLKNPKVFKRMGIRPPKGILLYGPPGTGKTLLAKAVATESEANFLSIKGPEIFSKWVGESEKAIRELFKKAKQVAPSIIFLDEIDAIAPKRGSYEGSRVTETVVNQLLTSIDGLEKMNDVVIIGATNRPDIVDPSLLRPGRFDELILVGPPDKEARKEIFKIHTRNMPLADDVDLDELADLTDGYVGADIEGICREAGMIALREDINAKVVKREHFMKAMKEIHPSIDEEMMDYYKEIEKKLGKGVSKKEIKKGIEVM
ncbi:MAG: AAA family ATPase [Thermoplasmata archaeon]|nr:MAG: AAA family ATPase [Thermoplasmata archaeon]